MKEKLIAMLKAAGVANPEAVAESMLKTTAEGKLLIDDGKDNIFIPKSRLDSEIDKKKSIQIQLDTANGTIKGLEKTVEGNQTAVDDIAKYQKEAERLQGILDTSSRNQAIKEHIGGYEKKFHDMDAVMAFLKQDTIIVKDGKVSGLDEQLKEIATSKPFLVKEAAGGTGNPGNPGAGTGAGGAGAAGGKEEESIGAQLGKASKEVMANPEKSFFS